LAYRRLLLLAIGVSVAGCEQAPAPVPPQTEARMQASPGVSAASPQSATYRLAGRVVSLTDGRHDEAAAPGSAARNSTVVWGAPVWGDLDQDGDDDAVVILVNEPGGSGTFYYLAAAEFDRDVYNGSGSILLGDRIALQGVTVANGIVTVNVVDRRAGDSLAAAPSEASSRRYVYAEDELRELEAPAAGEECG
jgi:hypothetical protein